MKIATFFYPYGHFEVLNQKGKHQGSVHFCGTKMKGYEEGHDINVK